MSQLLLCLPLFLARCFVLRMHWGSMGSYSLLTSLFIRKWSTMVEGEACATGTDFGYDWWVERRGKKTLRLVGCS